MTFSAEISHETSRNWKYTGIFPEQEFRRTRSVTLHGILGVWHKHACAICVWSCTLEFSWCNELRRTSHHIPWLIGVHATNNVCKLFFFLLLFLYYYFVNFFRQLCTLTIPLPRFWLPWTFFFNICLFCLSSMLNFLSW